MLPLLRCAIHSVENLLRGLLQEWREVKLSGKDILKQAQPHFETFKALFTHGVLGISHSGRPIWVMKVPPSCPLSLALGNGLALRGLKTLCWRLSPFPGPLCSVHSVSAHRI